MQMQKIVSLAVVSLSLVFTAAAADLDYSRFETYLGYDFVQFMPNTTFLPQKINANGGSAQFIYNMWKGFGVVGDFGAVHKGTINQTPVDATVVNFLAGPRYTLHKGRYQPFLEAMFGGAYGTLSAQVSAITGDTVIPGIPANTPITARLNASSTRFAMMAGGGLDIKLNKQIAFRPFEADYYLIRMPNLFQNDNITNRNNWRLSGGVKFMFGAQ
jgi:hypothetical protein